LANASPVGDLLPVLMAYNSTLILENSTGQRMVKLTEFVTAYRQTVLQKGEIIRAIIIPKPTDSAIIEAYKISKRKDLDISTVSAGFYLELTNGDTVKNINLYYGGMASITKTANKTEKQLIGQKWNIATIEKALPMLEMDFAPISDARAKAEARAEMAKNLLVLFFNDTTTK